ncbi:MAG: hypothetical protein BGO49_21700 [Planctomycetales bacterium 71-10]|nr:MAG: hypothetical protein BGO49_21700 [Planctomycetales bacterium 71-10]
MAVIRPPTTSPTLLGLLALPGSDDTWKVFVDRYSPLIEDRCRRAGLQPCDAEDVRAAVCMQLVAAMKGFRYDPARRFRGYLQRVVEHAIRTHWRVLRRRPGWVGWGGDRADSIPEPLVELGAELDERLRSQVDDLQWALERVRFEVGPENWRVFELTVVEGLSGIEAARRLGKSAAAVYMAKCRVRKRLLAEAGVEGAD